MATYLLPCRCGHRRGLHVHYRTGTDCSICGTETCHRYRTDWVTAVRRHTLCAAGWHRPMRRWRRTGEGRWRYSPDSAACIYCPKEWEITR